MMNSVGCMLSRPQSDLELCESEATVESSDPEASDMSKAQNKMSLSDNIIIVGSDSVVCKENNDTSVLEVVIETHSKNDRSSIFKVYRSIRDIFNDVTKSITFLLISAAYAYFISFLSYTSIYDSNIYLSLVMTLFLAWTGSAKIGTFMFAVMKKCSRKAGANRARHGIERAHHLYVGADGEVEVKICVASIGFILELMELITIAGIVLSIMKHDTYHTIVYSISFSFNLMSLVSALWSMKKGSKVPIIGCLSILMLLVGILCVPFIVVFQLTLSVALCIRGPKHVREYISLLKTIMTPYSFLQRYSDGFIRDTVPYFRSHGKRCYETFYWY